MIQKVLKRMVEFCVKGSMHEGVGCGYHAASLGLVTQALVVFPVLQWDFLEMVLLCAKEFPGVAKVVVEGDEVISSLSELLLIVWQGIGWEKAGGW